MSGIPSAERKPFAVESAFSTSLEISEADAAMALRQLSNSTTTSQQAAEIVNHETKTIPVKTIAPKPKPKRKRKRPNYEPAQKQYVTPTDTDVLFGRGGRTNHHPGNHQYLQAKAAIQPRYLKGSKEEKTKISQELVDLVHNKGGRFLKYDEQKNQWYVVANIVARKKASQTLRERNTAEERAAKRERYQYGKNGSAGSQSGSQSD